MNIEKRRQTTIRSRDKVHKNLAKPLLEDIDPLKPEYQPEEAVQLYEMTLKKHRDIDKIPVTIAMFGKLISFIISFLNEKTEFILFYL